MVREVSQLMKLDLLLKESVTYCRCHFHIFDFSPERKL